MSSSSAGSGRWSIGRRIAVWCAASSLLLILLTATFLERRLARLVAQQMDRTLAEKIAIVQRRLEDDPIPLAEVRREIDDYAADDYASTWLRVTDARNGDVIVDAPGMPAFALKAATAPRPQSGGPQAEAAEVVGPDGSPYRVLSGLARAGRERRAWLVIGVVSFARESELLARYRGELFSVLVFAGLATVPLGLATARRALTAVNAVSAQVQDVTSQTLDRRLRLEGLPEELVELARTVNGTLDRLQDSFERLGRFSSDIAHELRTPLSNLHGEIEVTLVRPREGERYRDVLQSALEECDKLTDIVDRLLFLARAENTQEAVTRAPLVVAAELERVREYYEASAQDHGVTLAVEAPPDLVARLDAVLFNRAITNLVSNAVEHTPPGGRVVMGAGLTPGGGIAVWVSDTGSGIPPDHLARVFDRFHRVDPARTGRSGGVGLGLAIVQSIARLHGGMATAESEPGKGTRITMTFDETRTIERSEAA